MNVSVPNANKLYACIFLELSSVVLVCETQFIAHKTGKQRRTETIYSNSLSESVNYWGRSRVNLRSTSLVWGNDWDPRFVVIEIGSATFCWGCHCTADCALWVVFGMMIMRLHCRPSPFCCLRIGTGVLNFNEDVIHDWPISALLLRECWDQKSSQMLEFVVVWGLLLLVTTYWINYRRPWDAIKNLKL